MFLRLLQTTHYKLPTNLIQSLTDKVSARWVGFKLFFKSYISTSCFLSTYLKMNEADVEQPQMSETTIKKMLYTQCFF